MYNYKKESKSAKLISLCVCVFVCVWQVYINISVKESWAKVNIVPV